MTEQMPELSPEQIAVALGADEVSFTEALGPEYQAALSGAERELEELKVDQEEGGQF